MRNETPMPDNSDVIYVAPHPSDPTLFATMPLTEAERKSGKKRPPFGPLKDACHFTPEMVLAAEEGLKKVGRSHIFVLLTVAEHSEAMRLRKN